MQLSSTTAAASRLSMAIAVSYMLLREQLCSEEKRSPLLAPQVYLLALIFTLKSVKMAHP
jgi:hypothetical protein